MTDRRAAEAIDDWRRRVDDRDRRIEELEGVLDVVRARNAELRDELEVMTARCRTAEASSDRLLSRMIGREA